MDLIKIGKYISNLEVDNYLEIEKLKYLDFNLWKIYRNHFCGVRYAEHKTKNKVVQYINKNIFSIFAFIWKNRKSSVIRTTSAGFNSKKKDVWCSGKVSVLKDIIEKESKCTIVGQVSAEKINRLNPKIDFIMDSFIDFYAGKLKYFFLPVCLISSFKHYNILNSFDKISFMKVLELQVSFLSKYILYYLFYLVLNPSFILFVTATYGRESEIAALKKLKIHSLEYQHGSIYAEHYGYNFHSALKPIKNIMLIPDKMLMYSNYWRHILLKIGFFNSHELIVYGHPSLENVDTVKINTNNKTPILLCSQPDSSNLYMKFIDRYKRYSNFQDKYYWIIKLHPREVELDWIEFIRHKDNIDISYEDTYSLFNIVDIQLAGPSTTLYEALHFGVSNYILSDASAIMSSNDFDSEIGKTIDINWTSEFLQFNFAEENKYFDRIDSRGINDFNNK